MSVLAQWSQTRNGSANKDSIQNSRQSIQQRRQRRVLGIMCAMEDGLEQRAHGVCRGGGRGTLES